MTGEISMLQCLIYKEKGNQMFISWEEQFVEKRELIDKAKNWGIFSWFEKLKIIEWNHE